MTTMFRRGKSQRGDSRAEDEEAEPRDLLSIFAEEEGS